MGYWEEIDEEMRALSHGAVDYGHTLDFLIARCGANDDIADLALRAMRAVVPEDDVETFLLEEYRKIRPEVNNGQKTET